MKKAAIRICNIRKHLKILNNALETFDPLEKRTLSKILASFLKQTKSLLTPIVRDIKISKRHEDQPSANTKWLELINNTLRFKEQGWPAFHNHALDQTSNRQRVITANLL